MAHLSAKQFRDYFGGSWSCRISKNGCFEREVLFNWPVPFGDFSALGSSAGLFVPDDGGILDDTSQIMVAGWRSDVGRWCFTWHNEFGGYGELQWTSTDIINNVTVLYGFIHECKQECDDPTDHVAMCEMYDQDSFKYTIRSFRKGLTEIVAKRIRTGKELNELMEKQAGGVRGV